MVRLSFFMYSLLKELVVSLVASVFLWVSEVPGSIPIEDQNLVLTQNCQEKWRTAIDHEFFKLRL